MNAHILDVSIVLLSVMLLLLSDVDAQLLLLVTALTPCSLQFS
jgi:hypothetical protein